MLGLVVFLFLAIGTVLLILWIRAATNKNIGDICETCINRKYLNDDYEDSPCQKCSKINLLYEFDKTILRGKDE